MTEKKRVHSITKIYYSNPKIQEAIFSFSKDREVVPSYSMESFGKRPDTLQYPADIMGLVNKGATSFHTSEEIWNNPLNINSDLSQKELSKERKSWDLLIDIDSPFLDYSKIAARFIIEELESQGIKNYGLKFSGSKGFHIIVPAMAFPKFQNEKETKDMFPDWPRAISKYLMYKIRPKYNKEVTKLDINYKALEERTKLKKEDVTQTVCPNCGEPAIKTNQVTLQCNDCNNLQIKPNFKITKRKLKCIEEKCPGFYEIKKEKDLFSCKKCGYSSLNKTDFKSKNIIQHSRDAKQSKFSGEFEEQVSGEKFASLDLVLVASRHLFRAPYSLHEKTALASIVLTKEELNNFTPTDAKPLKVKIKNFYPTPQENEAQKLLIESIDWKSKQDEHEEKNLEKKYQTYENIDLSNITEDMFPKPIKKLLKGLQEGKKRGLFVLLTFLRSINFSPDQINKRVREWNKLNDPPLKEGYIKSQIDWHLKQKRKILPPNYKNDNFYKDLQLFDPDKPPTAKNPLSEITRKARKYN
jgi:hypothetical protein